MDSNIIELVKSGHELSKELHCAESAALVSDLASQLEVQFARSNALAAENAGLKSKAAELVHEASEVYSAYNSTITEPDGDFMDMQTLQEMQCVETPATDAFLTEVRAQGVEMFAKKCSEKSKHAISSDTRDSWWLCGEHAGDFASQLRKGAAQ